MSGRNGAHTHTHCHTHTQPHTHTHTGTFRCEDLPTLEMTEDAMFSVSGDEPELQLCFLSASCLLPVCLLSLRYQPQALFPQPSPSPHSSDTRTGDTRHAQRNTQVLQRVLQSSLRENPLRNLLFGSKHSRTFFNLYGRLQTSMVIPTDSRRDE